MYMSDDTPCTDQTQDLVQSQQQSSAQRNSMDASRIEASIPPALPPPRTYSFHETTFARRLHRATLEAGTIFEDGKPTG